MGDGVFHRGDSNAINEIPFCSEVIKNLKEDNAKQYLRRHPKQQKIREMNGANLDSPIRGELGYAHRPQLDPKFIVLLGTEFGAHYGKNMFALALP